MNSIAPSSIPEVVSLIEEARHDKSPLWFTGSGTAEVPDGHTVVSTRALTGIVDYRPDDLTIVVRSGTTLAQLEETLRERGHTAVLPESSPQRTVGGVVASGASGYRRLRYGPTRDRVVGTTVVTGYGQVVHAGGQLVKNVTGYDIPRLLTGSSGALGFIAEISLKLWPDPHAPKTLKVADPDVVRTRMYQPTAALETENGGFVYVSDTAISEGSVVDGYTWPDPLDEPIAVAVNVPTRYVTEAIDRVRDLGVSRFVAQHGVGVVDATWNRVDVTQLGDLRHWAESVGGSVAIHRRGPLSESLSVWGGVRPTLAIERRLKDLFDPDRVCNPGVLAGDL